MQPLSDIIILIIRIESIDDLFITRTANCTVYI